MLNCIANVSVTQSMYLPSQNVVTEFMAVESYGGMFGESTSHQSYKYSGKEMETMNGLNTYDFHARPYYYPVLQFHSPDLLSEKTPWLSPYLYCAGNPIMLIDPTGMEFTEVAQKYANNLIAEAFNKIINSDISSRTDWNVITQAVNTINETIELQNSSQLYDVVEDKSLGYGFGETRTNSSKGTVEIALGNMDVSIDLIAHEFKHLSQFENEEISLTDKNAKRRGYLLYDKTDEMDAYYRGFIFGGPEIKYIKDLPENYQDLPNEQMNINIFLKRNHPFSTSNKAIDDILKSRSKVQKQSFRYKGKTYFYKAK